MPSQTLASAVGRVGPYRTVQLSKVLDPATERRRCVLHRKVVDVNGVRDFHTDIDLTTHLGTHVEAPSHHGSLTKDVTALPADHYLGRGVRLNLTTCAPKALITRADLEAADRARVRPGDVLVLDSRFHSEPFVHNPDDQRPHLSRESAEWFLEKKVKAVGFGDGICIENNIEHCVACHDIMLGHDILFLEVLKNLEHLRAEIFLIVYLPLPIRGLDASPVNIMAIEGIPGFCEK
ncbi:MAG TPA: cyclase family protein [Lacunisphaera sp.]